MNCFAIFSGVDFSHFFPSIPCGRAAVRCVDAATRHTELNPSIGKSDSASFKISECQILLVSRHFKAKPARQPAKFPMRRASGHRPLKFQQTVPKLTFSKAHSRLTNSAARERLSSSKPSKIFHNLFLHPNRRSCSLQLLPIYRTTALYHRRGGFTKPSSPANREPTRPRRGGKA